MSDQENKQEQAEEPTEATQESSESSQQPDEQPDRLKETTENIKETTEKLWDSTRQAWTTATFKASQYKLLVQKKIDLSAIHKKIGVAHGDLGRLIDDLRDQGKKNIMNLGDVKELLKQIDSLKASAAALEEEIENIKASNPPDGEPEA